MLYPSLEDLKVDQLMREQISASSNSTLAGFTGGNSGGLPPYPVASAPPVYPFSNSTRLDESKVSLYPTLNDYMGLDLTSDEMNLLKESMGALTTYQPHAVALPSAGSMIAPLTSDSLGYFRAQVTHGLREVNLCKDAVGKVGLRVKAINKGIFIVLVQKNSPASMVGLRFGDQILEINGELVAGYSMDKVHNMIINAPVNNLRIVVRDRPFERTITLHKDSTGHIGFSFKHGRINAIVKDSSAARNGLLTEHNLLEVNGQNVVGVDDKETRKIIEDGENVMTLTIMPSSIFDHMMKQMATSLVKKLMDHSLPDL